MLKSRQINRLLKLALKLSKDEKNIKVDFQDGKNEFHYPPKGVKDESKQAK